MACLALYDMQTILIEITNAFMFRANAHAWFNYKLIHMIKQALISF